MIVQGLSKDFEGTGLITSIHCDTQFKMRQGSLAWRDCIQFNLSSQHQLGCAFPFGFDC